MWTRHAEILRGWGAPGFLHLCICQRRQGGLGSCSGSLPAPSTDAFLPLPFLALTLCPYGGGEQSAPSWWRDCLAEAAGSRAQPPGRRAGRGGGLTASGQGPWEHLAQAFYTLQCNFFILFYSDYDYSGILSLR